MPNEEVNFEEVLVAPLEAILRKIASAIADAQLKLDEAMLNQQREIKKNFPKLAELGYIATWYHMPEVNVELKMVMHYEEMKEKKYLPLWSPFNAKYRSNYSFEAEGSSILKLKIVSTPPPPALTAPKTTTED